MSITRQTGNRSQGTINASNTGDIDELPFQHQTLRSSTRRSRRSCHDAAKRGQRSHLTCRRSFYQYTGATPLANIAPGTVLNTRVVNYQILGISLGFKATQLLYRSTDAQMRPVVNVTTVIKPNCSLFCPNKNKVLSYQSFYDSLNPADQPSWAIAGGKTLGDLIPGVETALIAPFLIGGHTVIISDTQGQRLTSLPAPSTASTPWTRFAPPRTRLPLACRATPRWH